MKTNKFLVKNKENEIYNQYWYSKETIDFIVEEVTTHGKRAAFLSTPSVYFSLKNPEIKSASRVFEVFKFLLNRLIKNLQQILVLSIMTLQNPLKFLILIRTILISL